MYIILHRNIIYILRVQLLLAHILPDIVLPQLTYFCKTYQPHDVDAEFHYVRWKSAKPAHYQQHVIVINERWDGPYGHDRGHDGGTESRSVSSTTRQRILVWCGSPTELRASSSWIRGTAHVQSHSTIPYRGPEPVQSKHQLHR